MSDKDGQPKQEGTWLHGVVGLVFIGAILFGVVSCAQWLGKISAEGQKIGGDASERIKTDEYRNPEDYIRMEETYGRNYSTGTIRGTLTNVGKFAVSDIRLNCKARGESGKTLDSYKLTITKIVRVGETVKFGPLDVGSLDQQAVSLGCVIRDAEIAYGTGPASAAEQPVGHSEGP